MKLQVNYKHLAAEFVIVVVGVAVALAADSWREDISQQSLKREYLTRIIEDLEIGNAQLAGNSGRNTDSLNSTSILLDVLGNNNIDVDPLVHNFAFASQTGGTSSDFLHDTTYRDLISTGRLTLIDNTDIRLSLDQYYKIVEDIMAIRIGIGIILQNYLALIGSPPEAYTMRGVKHSEDEISRILKFVQDTPELSNDLRRQRGLQQLLQGRFQSATLRNRELIEELRLELAG